LADKGGTPVTRSPRGGDAEPAESPLVSSVELVYRRTQRAILQGEYPPGSPLRLQQLARTNAVSLIPVREALRMLEAEGFVETIRNRGARVSPISPADVLDVYRCRMVLEAEALRQAFPHFTPEKIARQGKLHDRAQAYLTKQSPSYYQAHRALHFAWYEESRSKWLMRMIAILWGHTERYRKIVTPRVAREDGREGHGPVIDALARHDAEGAVQALQRHLQHTVNVVQAIYDEEQARLEAVPKPRVARPDSRRRAG
jgi:DNA-binding GntR family transcriptional regulator